VKGKGAGGQQDVGTVEVVAGRAAWREHGRPKGGGVRVRGPVWAGWRGPV
jgi:hypothetical protein